MDLFEILIELLSIFDRKRSDCISNPCSWLRLIPYDLDRLVCEEARNAMLIGMVSKDAFDCGVKPSVNKDFELVLDNLS